uniref:Putative secreted protein synganglion overexpressed n=1 Tax=Rhipicephalus microplus TaxID=6941 RepID=A0A6M2DBW9_RHIMP
MFLRCHCAGCLSLALCLAVMQSEALPKSLALGTWLLQAQPQGCERHKLLLQAVEVGEEASLCAGNDK